MIPAVNFFNYLNNNNNNKVYLLTDFRGRKYINKIEPIEFTNIDAGKYYIRIIYDSNQNGQYDSGSFLERRMPERVSYFPEELDVRAGWDLIQEFILK